jgi:hypothetical protein
MARVDRHGDLRRLYALLAELEQRVGGARLLEACNGRQGWPQRGVYFFFEDGEQRQDSDDPRVVRVGTHGLRPGGKATLWGRLSQHRGTGRGGVRGGNHRGSVFRLHVGQALLARGLHPEAGATWARKGSAPREVRLVEAPLEAEVSRVISAMRVLWVDVPDEPSRDSARGVIEAGAIALLSNAGRQPLDPPSPGWLGHSAPSEHIRASGLWNVRHVNERHDPGFLEILAEAVERTGYRRTDPGPRLAAEQRPHG